MNLNNFIYSVVYIFDTSLGLPFLRLFNHYAINSVAKFVLSLIIISSSTLSLSVSPGATTPLGVVFYSSLAGFSLLACEIS